MGRMDGRHGLLIVGSGCADPRVRAAYVAPLGRALVDAFHPDATAGAPVRIAFTSDRVRAACAKRGVTVPCVADALEELWAAGVRDVTVAVTHVVGGASYRSACRAVRAKAPLFDAVHLAAPLLSSAEDAETLAQAIDARYPRCEHAAVVLVGHGADGVGQLAYAALGYALHLRGRDDVMIGALRGEPSRAAVRGALERMGARDVALAPLMVAPGIHAQRDVLGTTGESWAHLLSDAGFRVRATACGLGAWPEVHQLAIGHMRAAAPVETVRADITMDASAAHSAPTARFPLFVDLSGVRCLVVGGGAVGSRRAEALARFGARVTVVDPAPLDGARRAADEVRTRPYRPGDEEGCSLVIAATGDREVNRMVGDRCRRLGVPVSVADASDECTFFFPALCEGEHTVAGVVSRDATSDGHVVTARAAARIRDILP